MDVDAFIAKWTGREGGAERANYAMFLSDLCDVLRVDRPNPSAATASENDYTFERHVRPRVSAGTSAPKRIDLYKKDCFILEAKQSRLPGKDKALPGQLALFDPKPLGDRTQARGWDVMMQNARKQAEGYVFLLDAAHAAPPFIITCDVGNCLELYADFTGTGRAYTHFPDRNGYRIFMEDLRDEKVRKLLARVWTEPHTLDPAKNAVRVTRGIAERLAEVSKALEERGANAEDVAQFLMRCLFTMFAEDVKLLPQDSFRAMLEKSVADPRHFPGRLRQLWKDMESGAEYSAVLDTQVRHFNGGLFKNTTVFELGREEIGELLAAAKADWREVDPAIFGTLLEQALDKDERRRLGAHYTPRAYVQRLVEVTVMEPLRADWQAALTKAEQAKEDGKQNDAIEIVRAFHRQLCDTRVLDPACGTGNFLYVSLELMKQLEGEVIEALVQLGEVQGQFAMRGQMVDPHQFLGLEINPRAAAIAELVVWIGYLQWHYRTHEQHPPEPILRAFNNITCMDAVLTWDGYPAPRVEMRDGVRVETYPNARRPDWPEAEFIVGNPPFSGVRLMRSTLGTTYVDALRSAHQDVPETSDYVLFWWNYAAQLTARKAVRRFGLISTNSVTQQYSARLIAEHIAKRKLVRLIFAVADHPWSNVADSASVRVAMTVAESSAGSICPARLGHVQADDTIRISVVSAIDETLSEASAAPQAQALKANLEMCFQGVVPAGAGFKLSPSEAQLLIPRSEWGALRRYSIGRDLIQRAANRYIIDLYELTEEEARSRYPAAYSIVFERVKPERNHNARPQYRELWWTFAEPRPAMRNALRGLSRFIGTAYTAKHRVFAFIEADVLPDAMIYTLPTSDGFVLAALSSRHHVVWSLSEGGTLEDRPRYNKARTFDPFPFPDPPEALKQKLRALGEELDATRKRVQAEHPDLTLTGLYNVLEKLKAGEALTPAEEDVKMRGRVLILKDLHEHIDAATAEAYGWPADLTDEQILEKLVALNAERAKEEAQGFVRWLRPDYQIPRFAKAAAPKAGELDLVETVVPIDKALPAFPADRYEQPLAIDAVLAKSGQPMTVEEIARAFKGKLTAQRRQRIAQVLTTLARYGRVVALDGDRFAARRVA